MFGPSGGASFLVKVTTILAILFFVITFALAYTAKQRADRLSGFDLPDQQETIEVDQDIPDVGVESVVDDSTPLEGDELPILNSPPSDSNSDASANSVTDREIEGADPQP